MIEYLGALAFFSLIRRYVLLNKLRRNSFQVFKRELRTQFPDGARRIFKNFGL